MKSTYNYKKIILLLGDVCILYSSLYIALSLRYRQIPTQKLWDDHFWPFSLIFIFWILIFYVTNLYDLRLAINNIKFIQLLSKNVLIASLFSLAFFYLAPQIGIAPKTNLLIFIFVFSFLFIAWRQFYNWSLGAYLPKNNIAIIGFNEQVEELIKELKEKAHLGFRLSFVMNDKVIENIGIDTEIKGDFKDLARLVKENKVSTLIFATSFYESNELRNSLFDCLPLNVNFISLPIFYENIIGKVPVSAINQTWFLENLSEGKKIFFDIFKRIYDIILAAVLLTAAIPFLPIVGLVVKLESKGPVFYTQIRLGKNKKPFSIIKLRTMKVENNDQSPTTEGDKRVTKFGLFLRKTRIDELPQLINILRGEMSFVGPRPERPELIKELEIIVPFYQERMLVKPGVTGWDQISGEYHSPSAEDTLKKLQYDLFYIKNRSIYLDFTIILKTIYTVLSRSGI